MSEENSYLVYVTDLLEKKKIEENDLFIVEDTENTKRATFRDIRASMIADNEPPASHRLYSSKKLDSMIADISEKVEFGVGSVKGSIVELDKTKVSYAELHAALDNIESDAASKNDIQNIVAELEATRKVSDLITSKDLAYGTEDERIHLKHLGSDILDAMTGHTQVSIPSVPVGGWTGDDLANGSIGAKKLKKDYSYRGNYPQGDLNRLVESGYYEVAATVTGVPHYGNDMNETRLLEVIRYGVDGKYIIQRVYYKERIGEIRPYFERKGLFTKLAVLEFVAKFELGEDNKVDSTLLADHYNNRGILNNVDLFRVNADGNYLCESTVLNLPTRDRYLVSIRSFDDRKEYEARKADTNGCVSYICYEYKDSAGSLVRTEWFNTTSVLKSKFDSQHVYIFGDGVSYGLGSTDINKKSYPAILRDKYGYNIHNYSLVDATAGNYNDNIIKETSLITQIEQTTGLYSTTDAYAIIFIGAEDYRSGVANIGVDSALNDTTFKGSLNTAIKTLLTKAPKCKILLVTPLFRSSIEPGDNLSSDTNTINDKYLKDFSNAIVDIGKYNHIPVLNIYDECMINKYNSNIYLNNEGVYPSDTGHAMLAEKIHDGMCKYY